jgi:hypothetical protein
VFSIAHKKVRLTLMGVQINSAGHAYVSVYTQERS